MTNKRITDLTEVLTQPSVSDVLHAVDVSDTSQHADGSSKQATIGALRGHPNTKNALDYGENTTPGTTDMLAAIQAAVTAAGAGGAVIVPPGTYAISGPILVETDNTHIDLQGTLVAIDDGPSFGTVEIDDTKVGAPQLKAMVVIRDCSGSSISGGGAINGAALVYTATDGMAGVYLRSAVECVVEGIRVENIFPAGYTYGGEGNKRYTGILVLKCTSCSVRHNYVRHCKYDNIGARGENTDIEILHNQSFDALEGIQSSGQYATLTPIENNDRTVIRGNEIGEIVSAGIVYHSRYVICDGNNIHSPPAPQDLGGSYGIVYPHGIRSIGAWQGNMTNNVITGVDEDTTALEARQFSAIRHSVNTPSHVTGNTIRWCDLGIGLDISVVFNCNIGNNILRRCNTAIDVRDGGATTRARGANIHDNYIQAYRYGIRAQDTLTKIVNNTIVEAAGWVGSSVGMELDGLGLDDTEYLLRASQPSGFTTAVDLPVPASPPVANFNTYIGADMINTGDRFFNRGELTVSAGNTTGTDLFNFSLAPQRKPGCGEVHVTQMSGPPVAFSWSSDGTGTTLTVTIASSQGSDCVFGWSAHLVGFVRI